MKNNTKVFGLVNAFIITLVACSFVETFTYSGFLIKHFNGVIGIGIFLIFIVAFIFYRKLYNKILFGKLLSISVYLLSFVYLTFEILEKLKYPNFIFSHLHLHPYLLLLSTILVSILFLINSHKKEVTKLIYTILIVIFAQYITTDIVGIFKSNIKYMLRNPRANYDQKMEVAIEKLPYDYAIFIKNNTPENAKILVPPQGYPWSQTSNTAYYRYFLYPRTLINGSERSSKIDINTVDYVLINYGETNISEHGFTNVWPKFDVKGEYIIYWNPRTGEIVKDSLGMYKYIDNDKTEKWGLIKIKH